jgi:hypothetical protein
MDSREALLNLGTRVCGSALASVVWRRGLNGPVSPAMTTRNRRQPNKDQLTSEFWHCGGPFSVVSWHHDLKFQRHMINAPGPMPPMQRSMRENNRFCYESTKFGTLTSCSDSVATKTRREIISAVLVDGPLKIRPEDEKRLILESTIENYRQASMSGARTDYLVRHQAGAGEH